MTAVVVIGSGFAGLWAALGAARRLDELAVPAGRVDITVLSTQPFHDIRVRNYEADLSACRIPLADLLDPVGVAHVATEVTAINPDAHTVTASGGVRYGYDRLVLASGSHVLKPAIPGCASSVSTSTRMTGPLRCNTTCGGLPTVHRRPRRRRSLWSGPG